jgi:hypothetical protein
VRNPNNPGGYGFGSDAVPAFQVNPVAVLERNSNRRRSNQVIGTGYGEVRLFGGLRYRANLGLNYADSLATVYTSATQVRYRTQILPVAPGLPGNNLFQATPTATNLLWENLLNYDGDFGRGRHRVSAGGGADVAAQPVQPADGLRQGFITDQQQLNAGSNVGFSNTGFTIPFRTNSLLSRATYAYGEPLPAHRQRAPRLLVALQPGQPLRHVRRRVGGLRGERRGVLQEHPRRRRRPVRQAARELRRARRPEHRRPALLLPDRAPTSTTPTPARAAPGLVYGGATQTQLANADLRWQRNRSVDLGLDLGLLNNTLTITADYYSNLADQVLVDLPLPALLGSVSKPAINAGKVKNAGVELGAQHRYERGVFRFNTALNVSTTATAWCRSATVSRSAAGSARCRRPSSASRSAPSGCGAPPASSRARPTCRTGRTPTAR